MDHPIYVVLLIIAAVCFALAAFNVAPTRVQLVGLGLLAWVLVPLLGELGVG